jgi:flagellar protein FliO/FliZ
MNSMIRKIIILLSLNLIPLIATADISAGIHHNAGADNPITFPYILQIIASFIAVVVFILFLAWLMRKSGRFGSVGNKRITIISSMSLGMREKIVLVNVDGVNIVVGVAPGQIRTLHVATGKEHDEPLTNDDRDGFGRLLGKFLK